MASPSPGPTRPEGTSTWHRSMGVDSSRPADRPLRVGVLSPHDSKETKAILNAVRTLGHEPVWIRDENLTSRIRDGTVRVAPDVDVLVNRLLLTKSDRPLEDLQLAALYEETAAVVNSSRSVRNVLHKYRAGARLAAAGLPVPDAFFGRSPRTFGAWREHLPETAVHKRTVGTNGDKMSVVSPDDAVNPLIDNARSFVQEFVDVGGERPYDVRVYVVGDRVVGAMRRHAPEGDWRTNVALGGRVEDVTDELGPEPRRLAIEATDALGLDVSGVDLLPAGEEWYVLEVNATAGFKGLFSATGVSPAPHIARLAVERAGGSVDDSRVAELATTLDDSVPACKPSTVDPESLRATVGATTRVRISGGGGAEATVARADTGSDRTSVDTELAGRVGAGPIVGKTNVRSGAGRGKETRPLVDVDLRIDGGWRTVTASVTDRSGMSHDVLLGRDVLEDYTVDVGRRVEE